LGRGQHRRVVGDAGGVEPDLKRLTGWRIGVGDRFESGLGVLWIGYAWGDGDGTHRVIFIRRGCRRGWLW
jgi:hypothetical protein